MKDKEPNLFKDFNWQEAQRNYISAMMAFYKNAGIESPSSKTKLGISPWTQAIDFWWQSTKGSAPDDSNDVFSKLVEQARMFYLISDQMTQFMRAVADMNKATEGWQDKLAEHFSDLKSLFMRHADGSQGVHEILGAWHLLPMDTLQRTFSSASFMPGDFLQDFKPDVIQDIRDKFLSVPGVGYTRESQEQYQEGMKLWNDYLKSMQEYNNALCNVAVKALEAMQKKILAMGSEGHEIKSLREVYDLWVDCNEDAYAELVFSEEYSILYGRLVNSLMAVKQHGRNMVDETLSAMNMPTRKGLDTIKKRQQEMRREFLALKSKNEQYLQRMQRMESQYAKINAELVMLKSAGVKPDDAGQENMEISTPRKGKRITEKKSEKKKAAKAKKTTRKKNAKKTTKNGMIVIKI